jgi:DNA topoisomerase-2
VPLEVRFDLYLDNDYYDEIRSNPQEFEKRFRLTNTIRTSNMVCFDTNSNIVKYSCIGDMMEAYYVGRLKAYDLRRSKEIERLTREAKEYDAKARFIKAVLSGSIELRNATDDTIVEVMKKHSLPPLSKLDQPDSIDAYEYLLKMRMDRVKASAVVEQMNAVEHALNAVKALNATTSNALWLKDLDEFQATWKAVRTSREEALADVDGKKRSTKKKFVLKK